MKLETTFISGVLYHDSCSSVNGLPFSPFYPPSVGGARTGRDRALAFGKHGPISVYLLTNTIAPRPPPHNMYRKGNRGLFVLLSRTQAGPGRTVKQEQEEISRNHVQTFIFPSL